jgi:KR domain
VFAPKVGGALHLGRAEESVPVRTNCLFSSIAALTGSVGQANYAAANTVLNTWAQGQCHKGFRTVSIMWGVWAIGMASKTPGLIQNAQQSGLGVIQVDVGLRALMRTLLVQDRGTSELVISPFRWNSLLSASSARSIPFFDMVVPFATASAVAQSSSATVGPPSAAIHTTSKEKARFFC